MKKANVKKITLKILAKTAAVLLFFSSLQALAAIPYRSAFEEMDVINNQTKELNLSFLARVQMIIDQNKINMTNYIPYSSLSENSTSQEVAQKIFRQTLKTFLDSDQAQLSPLAAGASQIQGGLSQTVGTTQHQLKFNLNAIEAKAEILYKGAFQAKLSYEIENRENTFEVSKQYGAQTYAFSHKENSAGRTDNIGVRWSF